VWTGTVRPYAAGDLLSGHAPDSDPPGDRAAPPLPACNHPEGLEVFLAKGDRSGEELLAHALAEATGDGLAAADAAVLYATSVLGLTMAELSELAGEPSPSSGANGGPPSPSWWPDRRPPIAGT